MSARFSLAGDPIGIGSIVIRWSPDATSLDVGVIVAKDPTIRADARWMVFLPWQGEPVARGHDPP